MKVAAENALYVGNDMHCDIFGAREVGMTTVMFDAQQGTKVYLDCVPDYTITDFRDLLKILDCPTPSGSPVIAQPPGGRIAE
jgi:putative hydrolase of the HAD superfamily